MQYSISCGTVKTNISRGRGLKESYVGVHAPRVYGLLMPYLDCLCTPRSSGGIGQQLRLNTPVHSAEKIRRSIDSLPDSQDTMILQDDSFILPERLGDIPAFLMRKDNAAEIVVDGVVLVEAAGVLVDGLELRAQSGEGFGGDAVAMNGADDVRTGFVDCGVDGEAGRVDGVHVAFGLDDAFLVYKAEIGGLDVTEGLAEGVDLLGVRIREREGVKKGVASCVLGNQFKMQWRKWLCLVRAILRPSTGFEMLRQ